MNGISQQFLTRVPSHHGSVLICSVLVEQAAGRQRDALKRRFPKASEAPSGPWTGMTLSSCDLDNLCFLQLCCCICFFSTCCFNFPILFQTWKSTDLQVQAITSKPKHSTLFTIKQRQVIPFSGATRQSYVAFVRGSSMSAQSGDNNVLSSCMTGWAVTQRQGLVCLCESLCTKPTPLSMGSL